MYYLGPYFEEVDWSWSVGHWVYLSHSVPSEWVQGLTICDLDVGNL